MHTSISASTVMNENNNMAITNNENQNKNVDSLKRKRPPKIEIPNVLSEIRIDSESMCFKKPAMCFSDHGVGLFCRKGKKNFMEDTHKIVSSSSHSKRGFFGVYDGHGGRKAAEFVADKLHSYVFEMLDNGCITTREKAIEAAYLKTDRDFLKQGLASGACCVTALIEGNEIIISNLGDCRAVLCRNGVAEALTRDHRAGREDERKRIEDKGGYVELHRGGWRVHGVLSVSRSIGDAHLKDWVPAEPDTKTVILTPDMEYLVLASDGLWDEVGNQEAVDLIKQSCVRERRMQLPVATTNDKGEEFYCASKGPSSKLRRVSIIKSKRRESCSPSCKQTVNSWIAGENEFGNENESPPTKARRVSMVNQTKMKMNIYSPSQENSDLNKKPPSNGLVAACRELVNLAVSRGSSDDVTVMVIDLNHFKS